MADRATPIAVVGAGASGLMAAVAASRMRPHSVLLLEKEARVGRKLLATGNGRCNLMNTSLGQGHYHGDGAAIAQALLAQGHAPLLDAFAAMGLRCREESAGRVYPFSGQASAVLDALRGACDRGGVRTVTDAKVTSIQCREGVFCLTLENGNTYAAERVILAGGGQAAATFGADGNAYGLLRALGHTVRQPFPALAPLRLPAESVRGLKGVRMPVVLRLFADGELVAQETGEALFTDYGISGVAAMQLARAANVARAAKRRAVLEISLMEEAAARAEAQSRAALLAGEPAERFFTGLLHKRLGLSLLRAAEISAQAPVDEALAQRIAPLLSAWRLPVLGSLPLAQAQITAGGASLAEFDARTLQSALWPGLYACGELLDVDGDCGGYNLMWAWASGQAAGEAAAASFAHGAR